MRFIERRAWDSNPIDSKIKESGIFNVFTRNHYKYWILFCFHISYLKSIP